MIIKKCCKFVFHLYKEGYVAHTRPLKQELNDRLILKKVHKVIKPYQKASLKPYVNMNTKIKTEAKIIL